MGGLLSLVISAILLSDKSASAQVTKRGYGTPASVSDADLDEMVAAGVNLVRIQVGASLNETMDGLTGSSYITAMNNVFDTEVDPLITKLNARGLQMIFVLYSPPGGFSSRTTPSNHAMFADASLQPEFISMWETIITRYGSNPAIYAFDLQNEPAMNKDLLGSGAKTWNGLLLDTIAAIRAINSDARLVVTSLYGDPAKLAALPAINDSNIIYSYNAYLFNAYQQSGTGNNPTGLAPQSESNISKKVKQLLGKFYLGYQKRAIKRQVPNIVPVIFVGEVAVTSMALDGDIFLQRLLNVIESGPSDAVALSRWNRLKRNATKRRKPLKLLYTHYANIINHKIWTVHAFGESAEFDPRYSCSAAASCSGPGSTDRLDVLNSFFALN